MNNAPMDGGALRKSKQTEATVAPSYRRPRQKASPGFYGAYTIKPKRVRRRKEASSERLLGGVGVWKPARRHSELARPCTDKSRLVSSG